VAAYLTALAELAYGVVLAENAVKVAVSEEDCSRTACADKGRLFTEVRSVAGNYRLRAGAAFARFALQTVNMTMPGAEFTIPENPSGGLCPLLDFAFGRQSEIGGLPYPPSSGGCSFLPFVFITCTVTGCDSISDTAGFFASFFGFLASLPPRSFLPMTSPHIFQIAVV
jgi:hypothetical protein